MNKNISTLVDNIISACNSFRCGELDYDQLVDIIKYHQINYEKKIISDHEKGRKNVIIIHDYDEEL